MRYLHKRKVLLFGIILIAIFLRIFRIDDFPKTLYGDEQAFAWNAYNILVTGQDEYGTHYPLQFRSFGDFKAPIPVYLLVPFIKLFGLNIFSVRLPIVIFASLTIFMTYLLFLEFTRPKIALLGSFLISISSWHVHLSRGFFESTLSLFFFVSGIYFLVKSKGKLKLMLISTVFFAMTIYSYFTPRILLLFFLPFLYIFDLKIGYLNSVNRKDALKTIYKNYAISFIILFIISFPLVNATIFGNGLSRYKNLTESMSNVITQSVEKERNSSLLPEFWDKVMHNKLTVWVRLVKNNFLEHFSINFWYLFGDNSLRYFTGNMGMFYLYEMPFFIIGLYMMWVRKRKVATFFVVWIILSSIPASLVGRPFAVRSLAMLPAPFIFVAYGLDVVSRWFIQRKGYLLSNITLTLIVVISVCLVLIKYYKEYPVYAATWWGWENKAAINYASQRESSFDNIFISDYYTGAPLAFAVYKKYDPLEFRKAINNPIVMVDDRHLIKLGKYYFGSLDIDKSRLKDRIIPPKSLYIGRPEEADMGETINAPDDNRVIFRVYKTQ